jgi:phosphoglycerol transferase MdoB-like AlkP superfamily enzyme
VARDTLAPGATFPEPGYPFVREAAWNEGLRLKGPPNVLLLFVEGLDRRYLGQTVSIGGKQNVRVRLTPFLDRLKDDSIYFEHFFSNGAQTHHGLFASFCSYYARYGRAAIKARYTYNYLCLPALLGKAGYRTEMVIGQNRDHNQDHTALFLARNGLQQFFDENDFPADAERLGFGMTDGALFDFVHARIEKLQQSKERFLLSTLTLSTHHPYDVPTKHPDVRALQADPDHYLAALRYADLELERFFAALQRDDLLRNTVVLILGDHGRHERNGRTTLERWSGHFTAPLFIWMDKSLRTPTNYQPRTVSMVASQVDLAPTILALAGLTPRVSPFLGRDLSCVLATDCVEDNVAFLSSVYDDLIGLADREGLLLCSLVTHTLYETDLSLQGPVVVRPATALSESRYRRLLALYVSSNTVLERNQIWSWTDLGAKL